MNTLKTKLFFIIILLTCSFYCIESHAQCGGKADCGHEGAKVKAAPIHRAMGWEICNLTQHNSIHVSIGYWKHKKWQSKGWWRISRRNCITALGHISNRNLYYLARVGNKYLRDSNKQGDVLFCALLSHPGSYELLRENKSACEARSGYKWMSFDHATGTRDYLKTNIR